MKDKDIIIPEEPPVETILDEDGQEMRLDDARRVKVLSPGMLVFKRFIRNKLAVVGLIILVIMFTFSFVGPLFSPYSQTQVFKGVDNMSKDYASAMYNTELRYASAADVKFGAAEQAQFLLALGKGQTDFNVGQTNYHFEKEGEDFYRILLLNPVAEAMVKVFRITTEDPLPSGFEEAAKAALDDESSSFNVGGVNYRVTKSGKMTYFSTEQNVAVGSKAIYDAYNAADEKEVASLDFRLNSGLAIEKNKKSFEANGKEYTVVEEEGVTRIYDSAGNPFAVVSGIIVNALDSATFLPVEFKRTAREAIIDNKSEFTFPDPDGIDVRYRIDVVNLTYNIKRDVPTELIRTFEFPSSSHWLGLDNNGMDMLTRLMYGGRVSLMVGFVVIIIEMTIGVFVGGISGYFGGAVDTALMRFVDLFNSIPFYPMVLIFGSVMDTLEVKPMPRIFLLMLVLGLLSWTGIARVVRGQILSLREQDFMIATEATGIRTNRRIFRHLVPNVMPLLIVSATAGLGGIIISEATLGFLGLGVKYPLASWGSIINVASEAYVMRSYWFMWIPAGSLILLTVLGFNFVGDGLRDAYDPKMKR
ncbi:MAG: ABC transporter permease [Anaerolineaceae bacterium]|jgi:peptide/nickel transport system permease protein